MIPLSSFRRWPTSPLSNSLTSLDVLLITALIAAGILVRSHDAGYSLDVDEVFSVRVASGSLSDTVRLSLADRTHPPLHNVLLHFWLAAFGSSDAAARSLSIVLAGASIGMTYLLGRRLLSRTTSFSIAAILVVSPFFVYYGQQARPYSLIAFLGAANVWLFARLMDSPASGRRAIAWLLASILLMYAHYIGCLLIFSEVLVALVVHGRRAWRLALVAATAGAAVVPWAYLAFARKMSTDSDPLDLIGWMSLPTPEDIGWYFVGPFGENPYVRTIVLLVSIGGLIVVTLPLMAWRHRFNALHLLLVLAAFAVPAMLYAIALVSGKPVFAERQLIWSLLVFLLVIGLCVEALPKAAMQCALALLLAWTAYAMPSGFPKNTRPPWHQVVGVLDRDFPGQPVIALESWVSSPLTYYRPAASISSLSDVNVKPGESPLVLCRPRHCDLRNLGAIEIRSWKWGTGTPSELLLLRISPAT